MAVTNPGPVYSPFGGQQVFTTTAQGGGGTPTVPFPRPAITPQAQAPQTGRQGRKAARQARRSGQSTTTQQLSPEQQQLVNMGLGGIQGFLGGGIPQQQNVPPSPVAPFDPVQLISQYMALQNAPTQQQLLGGAASTNEFLMNPNILSPESNPALAQWQTAANRPLLEAYTADVLPAIGSQAQDYGQFGGSRHGVAQGLASRSLFNAMQGVNADIANQGYGQGLQAMLQSLGLAPQTAAAQNLPAATVGAVGDVRQGQSQSILDSLYQALLANQDIGFSNAMLPWAFSQDLLGMAGGIPGGTTVSQTPQPRQSILGSVLGGAATGASFGRPLLGAALGGLSGIGSNLI